MKLGDRLSPEGRRDYVRQSLVPGRIIHLHCDFTTPPKQKFAVVASVTSEPPVIFLINSQISDFYRARPHLRDCQVSIQRSEHAFLQHDSFLDCTRAIRQVSLEGIEQQMLQDLNNIKDMITEREREAILYSTGVCRTLSEQEKELVRSALAS